MEIYYCDGCGMRIKGEAFAAKNSDTTRYCEKCAPTHTPISTGNFKLSKPATGSFKNTGASVLSPDTGRKKIVRPDAEKQNNTVMAAAGGGVAALVIVLYLVFGRGSSDDTIAQPKPADEKTKPVASAPAQPAKPADKEPAKSAEPAVPAHPPTEKRAVEIAVPPPPVTASSPEDFRESYARRRYDDLLAQEKSGALSGTELRSRIAELATSYGMTSAGKEAAEKLKALPEAPKPAEAAAPAAAPAQAAQTNEGPTQILWQGTFDTEADFKTAVSTGTLDATTQSGTGNSVKSEAMTGNYFTARSGLNVGGRISNTAWFRIHYKIVGSGDFCFHVVAGGKVYEKFLFGPKSGEWTTALFRLNDFNRCIQGAEGNTDQPPVGSDLQGMAIFLGGGNGGTLFIDKATVGEGVVPAD
jgi:hypothetical protein